MQADSQERRRSERLPGKGAKAVLVTKRGQVAGVLAEYSVTGALVEADGRGLVGTRVVLCVEGPERVWERKGTVVWVSAVRGIAIEFESDTPGLASRPKEG